MTSLRELVHLMATRRLSAREVMTAHLDAIERWNPCVNAIVALLDREGCLRLADAADARLARHEPVGPLHGIPWAFKDLEPVIGFPWTRGSPLFRDDYPAAESALVRRLRCAGALPIGKTNTPEFGMGSHTYNRIYGTTRNPYDLTKSAGGSSGGAAAAVATGMLAAADGSDLGGSLRNPGNFNNVVGLRPSVGLVSIAPNPMPLMNLSVKGPIARSVADVAYLLGVMAGRDADDPISRDSDPALFHAPLEHDFKGVHAAWCPDLGGLPLDARVRNVLEGQRRHFEALGMIVDDAAPDLSAAEDVFMTLRAFRSFALLGPLLEGHRADLKPEAIWEIEQGARITPLQLASARRRHDELLRGVRAFQQRFPFILAAVNQLPPFAADIAWPRAVAGVPMEHYIAWMKSTYWITATMNPAISVPAGFTADGLPVGLQIVGRYWDDFGVLQLAHAFEAATVPAGHSSPRMPVTPLRFR